MTKTFMIIVLSIVLFVNTNSIAQSDSEDGLLDGYMLGTTIRQLDTGDVLIADIPLIEARIPLGTNVFQFKYGGNLMWGLTDFFVEWDYATGILIYPFGKFIGLNATARLGSFFFDNISYTGAVGVNLDIPFSKNRIVSFGVEYFYRNSRVLFDFVSFGSSASEEPINIDSAGIGISIGFRF